MGTAPHLRSSQSVPKIFWTFTFSLLPAAFLFIVLYRVPALTLLGVSVVSAMLGEVAGRSLFKQKPTLSDGSSFLAGLVFALMFPPSLAMEKAGLAIFLALFFGREFLGGRGANFFHPALLGLAFLEILSPGALLPWPSETGISLALLAGGAILIWKKIIYWETPFLYLLCVFLFTFLLERNLSFDFLKPSFLLIAFYLITDPVTTPMTRFGTHFFAFGSVLLGTGLKQGILAENGIYFGVLLMNAASPWIDAWIKPRTVAKMKSVSL